MAGTEVPRFDRTLRAVMWTDAFLSFAVAVLCMIASPIVAAVGLPHAVVSALGYAAIGSAVLLAECGAITAMLIILRMRRGQYLLPAGLRLPLPAAMCPPRHSSSRGGRTRPPRRDAGRPSRAA